ncbi:hypothetical protein [Chryseobacterium sp.]|uniref:hypothetical protein n=1 Tax=Chryseobacterium sp. TaxID=1871047 RepID=UPI0016255D83|nr:hypothetical protein [Chryseobacterium sp.]
MKIIGRLTGDAEVRNLPNEKKQSISQLLRRAIIATNKANESDRHPILKKLTIKILASWHTI